MIEKVFKSIREKPQDHIVFLVTFLSFVIGLCAWQYCKGYYQTIGISISYSHVDNLIFMFDQITKIRLQDINEGFDYKWYHYLMFVGLLTLVEIVRKLSDWCIKKEFFKKIKSIILVADWLMPISCLIVYSILGNVLAIKSNTIVGSIVIGFFFLWILVRFILEVWHGKTIHMLYLKPLKYFIYIYVLTSSFYFLGSVDGKNIAKNDFSNLDSVCLTRSNDVVDPAKSEFQICGKLVHIDSSRVCIKDVGSYPICRQKELYEITVIPN